MGMIPIGQMIYGILFDKVNVCIPFIITALVLIILAIIVKIKLYKTELDKNVKIENV